MLVQVLIISLLDDSNSLLVGLPACIVKPLQRIQNAAAHVVFNQPKQAHVTPLFVSLHWLPVVACIKFKALMLAFKATNGMAPSYIESLIRPYVPSCPLRSANEQRLVIPSLPGTKSLYRIFVFVVL